LLVLCEDDRRRMLKRRLAAPQQTRTGTKFSVYDWRSKKAKLQKERKAKSD